MVAEYANAKTTDKLATLASGQVYLPSYQPFIISTAGFDKHVPMFQQNYPYAKCVLSGVQTAERYFAFIAALHNDLQVAAPNSWIKSNPHLAVAIVQAQITDY